MHTYCYAYVEKCLGMKMMIFNAGLSKALGGVRTGRLTTYSNTQQYAGGVARQAVGKSFLNHEDQQAKHPQRDVATPEAFLPCLIRSHLHEEVTFHSGC